jgi:hypothetical protein
MDTDTIQILRALCSKVRDMTSLLDLFLAQQSKKIDSAVSRQPAEAKAVQNRFVPLVEWPHGWPTLGALRHLASRRHKKGLGKVFIKVGKRVVIDEQAFFDWVKEHSSEKTKSRDRLQIP